MEKSPAFQFYANDWLSSTKINLMKPEEEGAYIRLLCYAWNEPDCGLPDDDEQLAILSRLGKDWLKGGVSVVRKCFFSKGGRLYNKRLLKERKKQEKWKKKSSEGGKKSAKVRWGKGKKADKGGYKKVTTKRQPNGNPSSSFSSSLKTERKEPPGPEKKQPDQGGISEKEKIEKLRKKPDEKWNAFILAYIEKYDYLPLWAEGRGSKKEFITLEACFKKIKNLGGNKEQFLKCFEMFLEDDDNYLVKNGHRPSLISDRLDNYWQQIQEGTY